MKLNRFIILQNPIPITIGQKHQQRENIFLVS